MLFYKFLEDQNGFEVTGVDNKNYKTITIPSVKNGKPVVSIGSKAFIYCENLEHIYLPDSLKIIKNQAFSGCWNLKSIILPNGILELQNNAFDGCVSLKKITIPSSLNKIVGNPFYTYSDEVNPYEGFYGRDKVKIDIDSNNINYSNKDNANVVYDNKNNSIIFGYTDIIPNGTLEINNGAFCGLINDSGCLYLPKSLNKINHDSFMLDMNLNVIFYEGTEEDWESLIEKSKINGIINSCLVVYNVNLNDLKRVNNKNYSYYEINNNIYNLKINNKKIHSIDLDKMFENKQIISLSNDAFSACDYIDKLSISNSIQFIGSNFINPNKINIEPIHLPIEIIFLNTLRSNKDYYNNKVFKTTTYNNCEYIGTIFNPYYCLINVIDKQANEIIINENCNNIGAYAFFDCNNIREIDIPKNVRYIGYMNFSSCEKLSSIKINGPIKCCGELNFDNENLINAFKTIPQRGFNLS